VLLGNGDGTFGTYTKYGADDDPDFVIAGDFNGDGKVDLAVINGLSSAISILLGNGDGTFEKPARFATPQYAITLAVGDFNGDGRLHLATGNSAATYGTSGAVVLLQVPNPTATLAPTSLTFPQQLAGTTSASQRVTLTNTGAATLDVSSIALTGAGATDFLESNTCGTSLASLASCTIRVAFKPVSDGNLSAAVSITDNAVNSPQTVALAGSATFFTVSPASVNFGNVPVGQTSAPQTVTVTNKAKTSQPIEGIRIKTGEAPSFAQTNNCGSSLGAGASCAVTVTFTPKSAGTSTSLLEVSGGKAVVNASLTGTGTD